MNPRRQLEEEVDVGEAGNYDESRLIECDGFSMNNLGDIDLLNAKYEEIKSQLPGLHTNHIICQILNILF